MKNIFRLIMSGLERAVLFFVAGALMACTANHDGAAKITLKIPQSKIGALSTSSLQHIALNVTGPGISEPIFYEADSNDDAELSPSIEVTVPSGTGRLIQVLAVFKDSANGGMLVKYGDTNVTIKAGANAVTLAVNDIVSGLKIGSVSGRYLTSAAPFEIGPTGRLEVKFPVGSGRPDMIVERSYMLNGWFSALASSNVAFKYNLSTGESIFDSLNLSNLTGSNFLAVNPNWFRIAAPSTVYVSNGSGGWKADQGRDLLTGYFAPEGMSSLVSSRRVCRPMSYSFTELAIDSAGTLASFGLNGDGDLTGYGGDTSSSSGCQYGGQLNGERMMSNFIYFSAQQLEGNHGDSISGQRGAFVQGRSTSDIVKLPGPYQNVSAAGSHTCAVAANGALYCWGSNVAYQLGDGTSTNRNAPTLIHSGTYYTSVSSGLTHTCGISMAGNLNCWGRNDYGEIGTGTSGNYYNTPQMVSSSYAKVFASAPNSTCAITTGGALRCWGSNAFGNLGDGTTTTRTVPVTIDAGTNYVHAAPGTYHTCGVTVAGVLKCWGNNLSGQIGDGTTTNRLIPVVVDAGVFYTKVYVNTYRTCAITASGQIKCWGANTFGGVGDGTTTTRFVPTAVASNESFTDIGAMTQSLTCGSTTSNKVICWGHITYGGGGAVRGDYGTDALVRPAVIYDGLFNFTSLSGGDGHSCGLTSTGAVICWGTNTSAQLGMTAAPSGLGSYRRLETDDMKAIVLRTLPGLMQGDLYGGSYMDGVAVFRKDAVGENENSDRLDCSLAALTSRGYAQMNYPTTYEPLTRSVTVRLGTAWPGNATRFIACPTKSGALLAGGMSFR